MTTTLTSWIVDKSTTGHVLVVEVVKYIAGRIIARHGLIALLKSEPCNSMHLANVRSSVGVGPIMTLKQTQLLG